MGLIYNPLISVVSPSQLTITNIVPDVLLSKILDKHLLGRPFALTESVAGPLGSNFWQHESFELFRQ